MGWGFGALALAVGRWSFSRGEVELDNDTIAYELGRFEVVILGADGSQHSSARPVVALNTRTPVAGVDGTRACSVRRRNADVSGTLEHQVCLNRSDRPGAHGHHGDRWTLDLLVLAATVPEAGGR